MTMQVTEHDLKMTETFEQTSDKPYDRHHYKLVYTNGQSIVFEDYMNVQARWFQTPSQFLSHIEVLDIPQKNKKKGFK
jgi:hypothetical protein